jgi:four helix bundle protein
MEKEKRYNPLKDKTLDFAVRIVNLYTYLKDEKREYVLNKQILRSGTNPGAMVREANNTESGADFIHKLAIGQKEIAETQYWLELLHKTNHINETEYNSFHKDADEISRMIRSSILTKKQNLNINKR